MGYNEINLEKMGRIGKLASRKLATLTTNQKNTR